jgi:hypothetical protein
MHVRQPLALVALPLPLPLLLLLLAGACRSAPPQPVPAPAASASTASKHQMPPECPCAAGSLCVPTTRAGERCLRRCTSDGECGGGGWVCDTRWEACGPPGLFSLKLAECSAAPLPRSIFTRPRQITTSGSPGLYQFEPSAALTRSGDLVVAFATGAPMFHPFGIATTVVHAGGTVDACRPVRGKDSAFDPWMAADPSSGTIALVWLAFEGAVAPEKNAGIAFTTTEDGATWTPTRYVHDARDCPPGAMACFDKPMVAWGPKGELYVFYETDEPAALKVVESSDHGATFGPATLVGEVGYGDVDVDASGVVHVVAGEGPSGVGLGLGNTSGHFVYARSDDGGATFTRTRASAEGESIPGYFSNPRVVGDDARKLVYVVYPRGASDGRWDIVLATSRDAGKSWSRIRVNDDAPCANHMMPQAALDPRTGDLHITWVENRTGRGGVAHARCESGGARCAANDAVSDAPFASYELLRFSPKWMGEYGSLFVDTRRATLNAVWTQPVADGVGNAPTARIFFASSPL